MIEYTRNKFYKFINEVAEPSVLRTHKNIGAWRDIYRSFGVNPKKKNPTAEALLQRVLKEYIPKINPAVDCYLVSETVHCLPIGGYDLDKVDGDIVLRYSPGNEPFHGIGSDQEEYTDEGEIVYSDNVRILTRRWNYKDCDYCKIDFDTKTVALFVEGPLDVIEDSEIRETIEDISKNLMKYCQGKTDTLNLGKNENAIQLR